MRANKGKDTTPELIVRQMLRNIGYPGYRLNWKKAPGRPDIAYPGKKLAIFVNGCFWHRCPYCNLPLPKSHQDYWGPKFAANVERDVRKTKELESLGWHVLTLWECQIRKQPGEVIKTLKEFLIQNNFQRILIIDCTSHPFCLTGGSLNDETPKTLNRYRSTIRYITHAFRINDGRRD